MLIENNIINFEKIIINIIKKKIILIIIKYQLQSRYDSVINLLKKKLYFFDDENFVI